MLPSGPSSLCFDKDAFMKPTFNVERFILECRRNVGLETLQNDLKLYLKVLQSAVVELINKDYADFVNLSSNLVGLDKAINNIMHPLNQLGQKVEEVKGEVNARLEAVEARLARRAALERKRATLIRLRSIVHSVEKMEQLQGLGGGEPAGELMVERVAAQFNKLQFHVGRSLDQPLVERIKPRIAAITGTLQEALEDAFKAGLERGEAGLLRQCLRTYAVIDKPREAENLFRYLVVSPAVTELLEESALDSGTQLQAMYNSILRAVKQCLHQLSEATQGSEEARGYDFVANSVWPELVAGLEARLPGLFAPGNPDLFHERYTLTMEFVSNIESLCESRASVTRLRSHASYNGFLAKWSLPVYFQIRFQEIAGGLEGALEEGVTPLLERDREGQSQPGAEVELRLKASQVLWNGLQRCWDPLVYLPALIHRFWKLSCQLISRYSNWIADSLASADMVQAVSLITDAQVLSQRLPQWFTLAVAPQVADLGADPELLRAGLTDGMKGLVRERGRVTSIVVETVTSQCSAHLRNISDLPRLYRRTNRDAPTNPSQYVLLLIRPIQSLLQDHHLLSNDRAEWISAVSSALVKAVHSHASDVLTSIRKIEESLRRLKKNKAGGGGAEKGGVSDDDKIRLQLLLDVKELGRLLEGLVGGQVEGYQELLQMVKSASDGPESS